MADLDRRTLIPGVRVKLYPQLRKARRRVLRPGSRGSTNWYINERGEVVYGDPPSGYKPARQGKKIPIPVSEYKKHGIPTDATDAYYYSNHPKWMHEWVDSKGRLQRRYSAEFVQQRSREKFRHVENAIKRMPELRRAVDRDLAKPDLDKSRVLAAVTVLLDKAYMRVGSEEYAREHGVFGASTLRKEHVRVQNNGVMRIRYVGKRGVLHDRKIRDKRLVPLIRELLEVEGTDRLFVVRTEQGLKPVTRHMVNGYLAAYEMTAKDFRTFHANRLFVEACAAKGAIPETKKDRKKVVTEAVRVVSEHLGNTPGVARAKYISPMVIQAYLDAGRVARRWMLKAKGPQNGKSSYWTPDEQRFIEFWRDLKRELLERTKEQLKRLKRGTRQVRKSRGRRYGTREGEPEKVRARVLIEGVPEEKLAKAFPQLIVKAARRLDVDEHALRDALRDAEEARLAEVRKYWLKHEPVRIQYEDWLYKYLVAKLQQARDEILRYMGLKCPGMRKSLLSRIRGRRLAKAYNFQAGTFPTQEDMRALDQLIEKYLELQPHELEAAAIKGMMVARIARNLREGGLRAARYPLDVLPETLAEARRLYPDLTPLELYALDYARANGAIYVRVADPVKRAIREVVKEGVGRRWSPTKFVSRYLERFAQLNRDARRIAITEANYNVQNGFLASVRPGRFVVGHSAPDACGWCKTFIHGQVYRVTDPDSAPGDYSDLRPFSRRYNALDERWRNEVWVGKSNFGRAMSPRKRTEEGLVARMPHELWVPVLPAHPHCRCTWEEFEPEEQYVDKQGFPRLKDENEEEWFRWRDNVFYENFPPGGRVDGSLGEE